MRMTQMELKTFECMDCGYRIETATRPGECPKCGGEMQNLGSTRE